MTAREIGVRLRRRELSCVELIQQTLANIKQRDACNSFITLMDEPALEQAAECDRDFAQGLDRGPWHGVPIAHKDLFYTRGIRTTAGSLVYKDFVPQYDATVVSKFRAAGAICVGKTNLHELAYGITSRNPHFGPVLNPVDATRLPGGSSGGSAAIVASGLLPMALGSDTGGSVRIPASFCGIVGLKPTYGRVSRYGVLPLAYSLDHVGPLASSVEDCALAMQVMAGADPLDVTCVDGDVPEFQLEERRDFGGVRLGVPQNFFFDRLDGEVRSAIEKAILLMEQRGAARMSILVPDMEEANAAARVIQYAEATALYVNYRNPALFSTVAWNLIQQGEAIRGHEYVNAQRLRTLFRREFDALWKQIDVLVTPTTPIVAPRIDDATVRIEGEQEDTRMASTRLVRGINFLGEPALSIPCGGTREGLPIGLQLIGPPFSEPKLLQLGRTLETFLTQRQ